MKYLSFPTSLTVSLVQQQLETKLRKAITNKCWWFVHDSVLVSEEKNNLAMRISDLLAKHFAVKS